LLAIAGFFGSLVGRKMGDFLSARDPNPGRIVLAQMTSAPAIILAALLLLVLPDEPSTVTGLSWSQWDFVYPGMLQLQTGKLSQTPSIFFFSPFFLFPSAAINMLNFNVR
jgi:hypothetical protein